ncbi:MAG: prepilin-type N-terminal cleavage/methylation domain-containing protein [Phycisphaerales bacterium]|nr:prepilin-type N-terminal cleavage/methylation domain-containing protein [Planctomycetota bacterium]MCH8507682.1 prepilin-type N-terminal cleavage/methylation domain-containing protein [Phycisphaerales bacterium]
MDMKPPSSRPGFTLVELLVVTGITLVLLGLLLPHLQQSRRAAFRTACTAQVRQMAVSITAYASDASGRVPFPFRARNRHGHTFWTTPNGRALPPEAPLAAGDFWVYPMLDDYGGWFDSPRLQCPLDNQSEDYIRWASAQTGTSPDRLWIPLTRPISRAFYTRPSSLAHDRPTPLGPADARVAKIFEVAFPSSKAFVFEEVPFHPESGAHAMTPSLEHAGLTVSAADGSVAVRRPADAIPPVLIGNLTPTPPYTLMPDRYDTLERAMAAFQHTRGSVLGRDW